MVSYSWHWTKPGGHIACYIGHNHVKLIMAIWNNPSTECLKVASLIKVKMEIIIKPSIFKDKKLIHSMKTYHFLMKNHYTIKDFVFDVLYYNTETAWNQRVIKSLLYNRNCNIQGLISIWLKISTAQKWGKWNLYITSN